MNNIWNEWIRPIIIIIFIAFISKTLIGSGRDGIIIFILVGIIVIMAYPDYFETSEQKVNNWIQQRLSK